MILEKYIESAELDETQLIQILITRLKNFFLIEYFEQQIIEIQHYAVLDRLYKCLSEVNNEYFRNDDEKVKFSYAHLGQYLIYFYSKVFVKLKHLLKDKFYYLNKIMNGVDFYCEVNLLSLFFFEYPIGMILGRAQYGENFFAMQGCTVGGNKSVYPTIGNNVKMFSDPKVLGNCNIGDNVWISANTYIKDQDVPSNSIVFGSSPNLIFKNLK